MKFLYSVLLSFLFPPLFLFSQIYDPVDWTFSKQKISENSYELIFTADIEPGWAIYSNDVNRYLLTDLEIMGVKNPFKSNNDPTNREVDCDIEICPIPVSFVFNKENESERNFDLVGNIVEDDENKIISADSIFMMEVTKFTKRATFKQIIKLDSNDFNLSGFLTYMACDDTKCLPPTDVEFSFNFRQINKSDVENEKLSKQNFDQVYYDLYGFFPDEINQLKSDTKNDYNNIIIKENKSIFNIFLLGLFGGFLALLTPCVFPMIPLTISYFTKKNENDKGIFNALIYGFFIFLVYLLLSVPFHLLDSINPDILNDISTNIILNILFFLIFLVFAFSFFGYFELTLPSSWVSKSSNKESKSGFIGIFFMALTLAIVSFSCTGPILGTLLAGSISGDSGALQLTAGMGGFGLALGLPFALFAMFPNVLNKLPKSGSWLNTIKVSLGFIELALALKFLSNADLVAHWGILKYEIFLFLWFFIFFLFGLYLLGVSLTKIKFSKRSFFSIIPFVFSFYLALGLIPNKQNNSYNALSLLSGLAPPIGYSYFFPKECPNDLNCFKDFKIGVRHAVKVNKPILLDFTGYACVNCRKMEEHVWPLAEIDEVLRDNFILVSLYVDDKRELPESEKIYVERTSGKGLRKLKNYGHKWAYFQAKYFKVNSQPFYLLMDPKNYQILNHPVGYMPDPKEYLSFLEDGLSKFKLLKEK